MAMSGFKQTELGPIPEDWEVKRLGKVLSFKNGFNAPASAYGRGSPFISVLDILQNCPITTDTIRGKVSANAEARQHFSVRHGDLLFMRSSETLEDVGKANVFLGEDDTALFGGFVIRGRPIVDVDSRFLSYLLKDESHRKRTFSHGAGAQHYNIGQSGLALVGITLPPLPEQGRIAAALADMDELIESLEAAVAKKQDIKQGVMQELVTGKKRLPGFEKAWVWKELGKILEYEQPQRYIVKSTEYSTAGIPVLTAGKTFVLGYTTEAFGVYDKGEVILFDDFLAISRYITFPFKVKSSAVKLLTLRDTKCCLRFIFDLMQCISFEVADHKRHWIGEYSKIFVNIPPTLSEQEAIASVLSDMDAEIVALEAKVEKMRGLKAGMMAELLTGRTRI